MKIYISASIPRVKEACDLGLILKKAGHTLVSYWHETSECNYHSTDRAVRDLEGVEECEMFIELIGDSESRGGRHCELGIALALDKQIILIGTDDDCIFTWLPRRYLTRIESVAKFIAERIMIQDYIIDTEVE